MDVFAQNPDFVFPFPVEGCEAFVTGAVCTLHAGPRWARGVGDVLVLRKPNSVQLTVISENYFDGVGSTITFSTFDDDGEIYLSQRAVATDAYLPAQVGIKLGYAQSTYKNQARNLRVLLRVRPSRPHIDWTSPSDWADLITGNWSRWF